MTTENVPGHFQISRGRREGGRESVTITPSWEQMTLNSESWKLKFLNLNVSSKTPIHLPQTEVLSTHWTTATAPHCAPSVRFGLYSQHNLLQTSIRSYRFSSPNLPIQGFPLHWELRISQPPALSPCSRFSRSSGLDAIFHTCQVFPTSGYLYTLSLECRLFCSIQGLFKYHFSAGSSRTIPM